MKVAVIGAGAVGGYFGGRLAAAGDEVTFLVRGKMLDALRTGPLRIDSIKGDFQVAVRATDRPEEIEEADVILVAVKAWQVPDAAAAVRKMPANQSVIVPLQNGMEAPQQLARVLGWERVAGGLCRIVSEIVEPGHIRHSWAEPSVAIGELQPLRHKERLEQLRDAFRRAEVRCDIEQDIKFAMWEKFLFIIWGAHGAAARSPIGRIRSTPELRARLVAALEELAAIARADGSDVSVAKVLAILDALPENTTASMQRDIMAGRPSELDAQVGAVIRFGREVRIATPVHDSIYAELLPLEKRARGLA